MTTGSLDPVRAIADAMLRRLTVETAPPRKIEREWPTPGALAVALDPTVVQTPALELIDQVLVQLADDPEMDRVIISMPPQEGKSERVSRRFPTWLLKYNPDLRIAIVSYTDEMARRHGSEVKMDVETNNGVDSPIDLGITLRADSRAAGRWTIAGHSGGIYCVGIGGSLTGKPVDILIIDDPIKNLEEAHSAAYRQRLKNFWQAVAIPRMAPTTKVVIIQTRWNEDDLAGWLQVNEPGQWHVLNIPAQAVSHDDPLGRKPGEFLQSARGQRDWNKIKKNVGRYVWSALYQGSPSPMSGGLFKRNDIKYWAMLSPDLTRHGLLNGMRVDLGGRVLYLDDCWRFLTVDLAASLKTSADFTAAAVWAIGPDGDLVMLDGARKRIGEQDHWKMVAPLRQKWSADVVWVESRMFGTTMVYQAGRAGVPTRELKADKDKVTRAIPASVKAESGRLWFPPLSAMTDVSNWVDELVSFPNAAHDDCVDVVAYAAKVAATEWTSQNDYQSVSRLAVKGSDKVTQAGDKAYQSATGRMSNGGDYSKLRW